MNIIILSLILLCLITHIYAVRSTICEDILSFHSHSVLKKTERRRVLMQYWYHNQKRCIKILFKQCFRIIIHSFFMKETRKKEKEI